MIGFRLLYSSNSVPEASLGICCCAAAVQTIPTISCVSAAHNGCCRCGAEAVAATLAVTPPDPACPTSSPFTSPPASQPTAPLPLVRQALERALLQSNEDFWIEHSPHLKDMAKQCPKRRSIQAMQFFLRLHILVACQGMDASKVIQGFDCCNTAQYNGAVYHICYLE